MKKKKTSATLAVFLAIIMIFLYLFGFLLKRSVFSGNSLYADVPVPALPYIFLFDSSYHAQLAAQRRQETPTGEPPSGETEGLSESETAQENAAETDVSGADVSEADVSAVGYALGATTRDYFSDALFIGDSRTEGLFLYSPFEGADYFSYKGMTIFSVFDATARDGKTRLRDLLDANSYGKIYIMLGINEIGTDFNQILSQYAAVLEQLKELAPDAILVVQASLSVSEEKSQTTWYLTAERIHELNRRQSALADGERVFYLDANDLFCDEKGYLKDELSGDGVHLYAKNYDVWTAWMCENAYVPTSPETQE